MFSTDVVDVTYREEETAVVVSEKLGHAEFSQAWVSNKQPKHIGAAYVIHAPLHLLKDFNEDMLRSYGLRGMRVQPRQPVFLRTDTKFMRITFNYGDKATASEVYAKLKAVSRLVYRNWL